MAEDHQPGGLLASSRLVIIGILVVIIVPALAFVIAAIGRSIVAEPGATAPVALNNSNACVACHRKTTPGIIEQYRRSSMAAANVTCQNCHEVEAGYPGGVAHHGTYCLNRSHHGKMRHLPSKRSRAVQRQSPRLAGLCCDVGRGRLERRASRDIPVDTGRHV